MKKNGYIAESEISDVNNDNEDKNTVKNLNSIELNNENYVFEKKIGNLN